MNKYKFIAREPTHNMCDDGHEALNDLHKTGQYGECPGISWEDSKACFQSMWDAAPKIILPKEVQQSYKKYAIQLMIGHDIGDSESAFAVACYRWLSVLIENNK